MAKSNFTKVENLLNEGLIQVQVNSWLELADIASGKSEIAKQDPARQLQARKAIAKILKLELDYMYKEDPNVYVMLGIDQEKLYKILDNPEKINNADYEYVSQIKGLVDSVRKGKQSMVTPESNEQLIEEQRKHHINKRFNVNDKWLPLR